MFRKATKKWSRLRAAFIGPAGSGKTWNSLLLASHLGKRVAVIDTERGSASKYADTFEFDVLELDEYHPQTYVQAIRAAEQAGYDCLVIDSLSHAWIGKGGALDLHEQAVDRQKGSKNTYTAWRDVTPHHMALVDAMLQSRCHIIATVRARTEYVQEKDERTGKTTVRKVGMAPVQRDGLEYEFDVTGDLDTDHNFVVSKTRCPALSGKVFRDPGNDLAAPLQKWLSGEPVPAGAAMPAPTPAAPKASVGATILARLQAREAALVAEGRCKPGELLDHVRQRASAAGVKVDIPDWDAQHIQPTAGWVQEFLEARTPPADEQEQDDSELADEGAIKRVQALLARKGVEWMRLVEQEEGTLPGDMDALTVAEAEAVLRHLDGLPDAKKARKQTA